MKNSDIVADGQTPYRLRAGQKVVVHEKGLPGPYRSSQKVGVKVEFLSGGRKGETDSRGFTSRDIRRPWTQADDDAMGRQEQAHKEEAQIRSLLSEHFDINSVGVNFQAGGLHLFFRPGDSIALLSELGIERTADGNWRLTA